MFSFKEKICRSAILPHHTTTPMCLERKLNSTLLLGLLVNVLHHHTGMMTEPQLNESGDPRGHPKKLKSSLIFLSCVINHPTIQSKSVLLSNHLDMRSRNQDLMFVTYHSHWRFCVSSCSFMFIPQLMLLSMLKWVHTWGKQINYP